MAWQIWQWWWTDDNHYKYQVLFQLICHFEDKQYNNILYGDGFGFSLLDYVNDLFFNEELESETSDDEDLSDGESVGSYEWNYWIVAIII